MTNIKHVLIVIGIFLISIFIIGRIIENSKPVYRTEYYQEPVYGTLYYGTLRDKGAFLQSDKVWSFDNAVSYEKQYTRQGSLPEYMFTMTNFDGTKNYYYDIDWWDIKQKPGIIRIDRKERSVCIRNCN